MLGVRTSGVISLLKQGPLPAGRDEMKRSTRKMASADADSIAASVAGSCRVAVGPNDEGLLEAAAGDESVEEQDSWGSARGAKGLVEGRRSDIGAGMERVGKRDVWGF